MKNGVPSKRKRKISDQKGQLLADNFYWLHADHDFRSLVNLPEPVLEVTSLNRLSADEFSYSFILVNRGNSVALMTQLKLTDSNTGLEILPTIWSDNFISLLPGEETEVRFTTCSRNLPDKVLLNYKSYQMKSGRQYPLDPEKTD